MRTLSIALACALAGSLHAQSPASRFANPIWPVGTAPTDVAAGDFDGDGRTDLATIGSGGFVHVARQIGALQFAPAAAIGPGNSATRIQAVEATGDGIVDLVLSQNSVRVLAGDGAGSFTALPTLFTASFSGAAWQRNDVVVANFNGDAWPDIAATDEGSRTLNVFLGIGGGAFAAPQVLSTQAGPHNPNDVAVADFDGDGNLDLVTCGTTYPANLAIHLGSASGTFAAPRFHAAGRGSEIAAGDFTGDGVADVATVAADSGAGHLEFQVGDGTGAFPQTVHVQLPVTAVLWPIDLLARDLDGDADLDALVVDEEGGVHAVRALGQGAFTAEPKRTLGGAQGGIDLSDFGSDGRVDLACTIRSGGVVLLSGDGQAGFEFPPLIDVGAFRANGNTLRAMDFDNDARTDLLFYTITGGAMGLARGNAGGGFDPAVFTSLGAWDNSTFEVGSFDPDPYPDLILRATNGRLQLWVGDGAGSFVPSTVFGAPSQRARAVGDLDGDGNADVLVEHPPIGPTASIGFQIHFGDGLGQFPTSQDLSHHHSFGTLARTADFDGNGREDILIAEGSEFVLMSQGTPSTFSQVWTANAGAVVRCTQLADLDGNGHSDIVASLSDSRIAIGLGQPGGTFGAISHLVLGSTPFATSGLVAIADFDADGVLDLAPECGDGALRLFPGDGTGGFGAPILFAEHHSSGGSTVALDYDGDGDPDIVGGNIELELRENLGASWRPIAYCSGKVNSLGCAPSIGWTGTPSATATSGFVVRAANVRNKKGGLLLYGISGRASVPFSGGTLCVRSQVKRSVGVHSGGSASGNDCTGVYAIDMNSFAAGVLGGNPLAALQVAGTAVDCQFWGRDPGFAPPNATALSDALEYLIEL